MLPPETFKPAAGSMFLPECPVSVTCKTKDAIAAFTVPAAEVVVNTSCIPVDRISDLASVLASSLQNDTLYRAILVTSDESDNQAAWVSLVRTQDLTPPTLTVLTSPPAGFTSFQLNVALNEPGVVFAGLSLASGTPSGDSAACPPVFSVSLLPGAAPSSLRGLRALFILTIPFAVSPRQPECTLCNTLAFCQCRDLCFSQW